jgi:hypothetical protein
MKIKLLLLLSVLALSLNCWASTEILRPNEIGSETWPYQYPSEGYHWDKVDEVTADGDDTYISTEDYTEIPQDFYICIKENDVTSAEIVYSLTGSYNTFSFQWSTKPSNSQAWTWTDIDNLQIGVMGNLEPDLFNLPAHSGSGTINYIKVYVRARFYYYYNGEAEEDRYRLRVTQVYVEVDYITTSSGPAELKTWNGLAKASVKNINGLAIGNLKSWDGIF